MKCNTYDIEEEHNEIYNESDEEEEVNTKMAEEMNEYQPCQTKSYMSNELYDNEPDDESYNKMDNNLVDNNYVVNGNNHIETNIKAYGKRYEIGNYEENQRQEANNNMKICDIFEEDYEDHEPHQFSKEDFDKLSFNKLMDLEYNNQTIDSEENEITDETNAHNEENEENEVTIVGK